MRELDVVRALIAGIGAWLSSKFGLLYPVVGILACAMVLDYVTGMLASRKEAIEHPNDPEYGWSSKKGAEGIIKKVGYLCVIAVAMIVDYIILSVAGQIGFELNMKAMFGLLAAIWYILNELLSVTENAGRMGAPVPAWLANYISILKNKVDDNENH